MTAPAANSEPETQNSEQFLTAGRFAFVLAALLAVTFWRVLFGGEAFFYRDYGFLGYPFAHFHRECFWSGDFFPLWNPYVNCGAPFLAQWNTLCLYPGALLYLLLPLPWSLGFFCVAHLFLGGMGMRALAERWTGSRFGAAVAGVAFVFSGLVLGCVIYPNYLVALGWMPWVVLATRRAWQEGGRTLVLAALAGAMQMLTGAPEIILLTWGFLAALLVVDWVQSSKSKVQSPSAQGSVGAKDAPSLTPALSRWEKESASAVAGAPVAPLANPVGSPSAPKSEPPASAPTLTASPPLPAGEGRGEGDRVPSETTASPASHRPTNHFSLITFPRRFLAVIALVAALCAAQLLPFFQLLSLSQRSGDAVNTFWSLPGWGWVNLFFPLFMNFQTEQGVFVMIGQSFFPSVYLGIVPLTLALLAVWRIGLRRAEVGRGVLTPPSATHTPLDLGGALGTARPTSADSAVTAVWEVRLLAGATLLAVLLAMGDNFPLWGWLRAVLPLGIMRFPVKALLLAAFTVPLLAAWGTSVLVAAADRIRATADSDSEGTEVALGRLAERMKALAQATTAEGPILGVLALALVVLWQDSNWPVHLTHNMPRADAGWLGWMMALLGLSLSLLSLLPSRRALAALTFLLLLATSAVWNNMALQATIPASAFEPGLAAAYHASKGALTPAPKLGESRIMLSPLAERALHTRMVPKFYDDFIGQRLAFWGNLNLLDGLPKVNGASTLVTREWSEVENFLYATTNPAPAHLMDFLGVTHTTKPGELMQWERRETAMPLVTAGLRPIIGDDSKAPFAYLDMTTVSYREAVLLPSEARQFPLATNRVEVTARVRHFHPRAGDLQSPSAGNDSDGRRLQVADTDTGDILIEAEAVAPTVVVIAQNFYPSWRATVNGQPAPVLRANHAFQAIPIPEGKSTVRLDYVDWPFRLGVGLSLAALAVCGLLWWRAGCGPTIATEAGGTGE